MQNKLESLTVTGVSQEDIAFYVEAMSFSQGVCRGRSRCQTVSLEL